MRAIFYGILLLISAAAQAQGPFDGYLKGKGHLDMAVSYSANSSPKYLGANGQTYDFSYKGSLFAVFAEGGLTKDLDLIGVAAYSFTNTKTGLQDGGLYGKYRFLKAASKNGYRLNVLAGSGISFPLSDYSPTANGALGTKAITMPARLILQLESPFGLFLNLTGGYNWRFDRAKAEDIAEVQMANPDFRPGPPAGYSSLLVKIGFPAAHYYLDGWLEWQNTKKGSDYSPNVIDLPQLYGVSYCQVGGTAYYSEGGRAGFYLSTGYILNGRNTGLIFRFTGGVVIKFHKKDERA